MGEDITTRIQKELTALKSTTENITLEMRSNNEKFRLESRQYTDRKFLEARAYADACHFELTEKINRIFSLLTGKEFGAYETPDSGYRSDAIGSIRNTAANTTTQLESIDTVSSNRSSVTTIDEHQEVVNILDRDSGPVDFEGTAGSNSFIHNFDRSCVGSESGDAIVDIDDRNNQSRVDVAVIKTVPDLVKCEDDGSVIVVTRDLSFVSMIETAKCKLEKEVIGSHVKIIADELKIEFANYEMHEWHNPCDRRYDPEKVADDDLDSLIDVYDRLISPLHNYLSVEPILIIQLPRRSEISYAMDKNGEYDAAFPAGLKILIVDDARTCLFVLEAMLRKPSYQVTKSQNARDALGLLRQHKNRFDLVMCDLHVSGMNGLKLLEIIRSEMDLPFVMVSSDDRKEAIMKGIFDGVCQYLVKPVKMEEARLIWQQKKQNAAAVERKLAAISNSIKDSVSVLEKVTGSNTASSNFNYDSRSTTAIEGAKSDLTISKRYLKSDFFIDLAAALPLPQIVIWFIIPAIRSSHADYINNALMLIVLLQYVPRLYLIFPLSSQIIKATGVVTKTAWAGAAYNLLLYMLASHVLGASWYLLSIERHATCWKTQCKNETSPLRCDPRYLDCGTLNDVGRHRWENSTVVFSKCDPNNDISFDYGIFKNALTKQVFSSGFVRKYFYCLWWGLQNLSSYGQTLDTSTFMGETMFAILIAIVGLVLFAHLIGNMQIYLQSITLRNCGCVGVLAIDPSLFRLLFMDWHGAAAGAPFLAQRQIFDFRCLRTSIFSRMGYLL